MKNRPDQIVNRLARIADLAWFAARACATPEELNELRELTAKIDINDELMPSKRKGVFMSDAEMQVKDVRQFFHRAPSDSVIVVYARIDPHTVRAAPLSTAALSEDGVVELYVDFSV